MTLFPLALSLFACTQAPKEDTGDDTADDTADTAVAPNQAPVVTSVTLSPQPAATLDVLRAEVVAEDPEGAPVSVAYAWRVNDVTLDVTSAELDGALWFDRDDRVEVVVTPDDGTQQGAAVTSVPMVIANTAPTAPSVALPSVAAAREALTCSVEGVSVDVDGDAVGYTFRWEHDGVPFTGAADDDLSSMVPAGDVTAGVWTCFVVADDGTDSSAEVSTSTVVEDACSEGTTAACGGELAALDWSWRTYPSDSCAGDLVATTVSPVSMTNELSACSEGLVLRADGHYATATFAPLEDTCPSEATFRFEMVGRLPNNYQRGLGFTLLFPDGGSIAMDRWVWNGGWESSVNVNVTTPGGATEHYVTSNADTGGARNDRPWGWYIGNDASVWVATLEVDTFADTIHATFSQPGQSATVYDATYTTPLVDGEVPDVRLHSWANCDYANRVTLDAELYGFTMSPAVWTE